MHLAPSLATCSYICVWGRRMMDEGPAGGRQTLAPLIYPHICLGGGSAGCGFSRACKHTGFFSHHVWKWQRFSCTSGGVGLGWNFPLSVEYNTLLFTKELLLIQRQSGIHLFIIQSNTLQLAWHWVSAFFSSMSTGAHCDGAHEGIMERVCAFLKKNWYSCKSVFVWLSSCTEGFVIASSFILHLLVLLRKSTLNKLEWGPLFPRYGQGAKSERKIEHLKSKL